MDITSIIVNEDLSLTIVSDGNTLTYVNQATVGTTFIEDEDVEVDIVTKSGATKKFVEAPAAE